MTDLFHPKSMNFTPFLFFTGKGGVEKTSTAVTLADMGKRVQQFLDLPYDSFEFLIPRFIVT